MDELTNWGEYITLFAGLFAIVNIPRNVPVFLNMTSGFSKHDRNKTAIVTTLTVFIVLQVFVLLGDNILGFFRINIAQVQIAGGVILMIYALVMVGAISGPEPSAEETAGGPVALGSTPLGVPLFAGPGAISTVVVYSQLHSEPLHVVLVSLVVLGLCIVMFVSLKITIAVGHFISPTMTLLISRIMGLIVAAIAVNFLLTGIHTELDLVP